MSSVSDAAPGPVFKGRPYLIAVGSENAAKVKAAQLVVDRLFEQVKVVPSKVDSLVSAQPMSDEECIRGAINRAVAAQKATDADFGLGMEGGISEVAGKWYECGWIAVVDKQGTVGLGSSARFEMPPRILEMVRGGMELGDVMDRVTGRTDVRTTQGAMGILTQGHLPRDLCYSHGILFAFARFTSDPSFWVSGAS